MISFGFADSKKNAAEKAKRRAAVQTLIEIAEELLQIQLRKDDVLVSVMELKCLEPNCPPMETCFAVLDKGVDCKFKIPLPLMDVKRDDIVDAIQAWVRGDAPLCACEFILQPRKEDAKKSESEGQKINYDESVLSDETFPSDIDGMMDSLSFGTM